MKLMSDGLLYPIFTGNQAIASTKYQGSTRLRDLWHVCSTLDGDLTFPRDYLFTVKAHYWKMSLKTKTRRSTPMDFRYVEGYSRI